MNTHKAIRSDRCSYTIMKLFVLLFWLGFLNESVCIQCPEHCKSCSSTTNCLQCNPGYQGNTCEEKCSNCKEGTKCKQDTGYCEDSCKVGKSGDSCDIDCNSTCMSCDRYDKNNCTTCAHDRYGTACNNECPSKCLHSTCNETDGICTDGCTTGFWGQKCENSCSVYCNNCDRNGTCLECANGYNGYNCSKVKKQNKTAEIVLAVAFGVLAVLSVVIFIKKRKTVIRLFQRSQPNIVQDPDEYREELLPSTNQPNIVQDPDEYKEELLPSTNQSNIVQDPDECKEELSPSTNQPNIVQDPDECKEELSPSTNQGDVNQLTSKSNNYFEINLKNKMSIVRIDTITALKEENLGESLWEKALEKDCLKIVIFTDKNGSEELREMFREKNKQKEGDIAIQYNGQEASKDKYFVKPFKMIKGGQERQLLVAVFHYESSINDSMVTPLIELHTSMTRKREFDGPTIVFSSKEDFRYGTYIAYDELEQEATKENIKPTEAIQLLLNLEKKGLKLNNEYHGY